MHDDDLDHLFAGFRAGGPLVVPAGPGAARAVLRHRRRVHAMTGGAAAALLLVAPAVALVTVDDRPERPNVSDTGAPTPPSPSLSPTPVPSTAPTPVVPDGRISTAQLGRATLDVQGWIIEDCPSGRLAFADGEYGTERDGMPNVVTIEDVVHVDLDGDSADETAALLQCSFFESVERMVVGFDRDARDRIVTMGPIVRSGDSDIAWIDRIRSSATGVEVNVTDIHEDLMPIDLPQHQWRRYSWTGKGFAQSGGPTAFAPNQKITDLGVTGGQLRLRQEGANYTGTLTLTVHNHGDHAAQRPRLMVTVIEAQKRRPVEGCVNTRQVVADFQCDLAPLAAGASRTVRIPIIIRKSLFDFEPNPRYYANVQAASGPEPGAQPYPPLPGTESDNAVEAPVVVG